MASAIVTASVTVLGILACAFLLSLVLREGLWWVLDAYWSRRHGRRLGLCSICGSMVREQDALTEPDGLSPGFVHEACIVTWARIRLGSDAETHGRIVSVPQPEEGG